MIVVILFGRLSLVAGVGLLYAAKALIINYRFSRTFADVVHFSRT